ncbi:phosphonate metabolism transcriptional regulator PhnF [Palleronia sp. KMU-117]|uniref:phosphonate metabolism transcriptional regulator PhnF n=1 Tax=Palleronia sp. KMU-117 TaxID=3434108 RepID=UPI003D744A0A
MTGARTPLWQSIATALSNEIAAGHYALGDRLPTEAVLSARFGVNRHTLRRALGDLAERGLVHSRRGSGVFVAAKPTDYPLGRRVRFHRNLRAAGRLPGKAILATETRAANADEARALALPTGAMVHVHDGLSLADSQPIAVFRSVFPAARFPDLPTALHDEGSVTAALARFGVADYTRASTRLNAVTATPTQALHLRIREGAPVLRTTGINVDSDGRPVEYGTTWFAGDRVTITLDPEAEGRHGSVTEAD